MISKFQDSSNLQNRLIYSTHGLQSYQSLKEHIQCEFYCWHNCVFNTCVSSSHVQDYSVCQAERASLEILGQNCERGEGVITEMLGKDSAEGWRPTWEEGGGRADRLTMWMLWATVRTMATST